MWRGRAADRGSLDAVRVHRAENYQTPRRAVRLLPEGRFRRAGLLYRRCVRCAGGVSMGKLITAIAAGFFAVFVIGSCWSLKIDAARPRGTDPYSYYLQRVSEAEGDELDEAKGTATHAHHDGGPMTPKNKQSEP